MPSKNHLEEELPDSYAKLRDEYLNSKLRKEDYLEGLEIALYNILRSKDKFLDSPYLDEMCESFFEDLYVNKFKRPPNCIDYRRSLLKKFNRSLAFAENRTKEQAKLKK